MWVFHFMFSFLLKILTQLTNTSNMRGIQRNLDTIGEVFFNFFFYPKLLYISSMKLSLSRTTILKLIVHGIELHAHATFEERENKQKNAKF